MQPDSFYEDIETLLRNNTSDKPALTDEINDAVYRDMQQVRLLTKCDPSECDGTHWKSTPRGRTFWAMLDKQRSKESPITDPILSLLDGGIGIQLLPIPESMRDEVNRIFNDKKETKH